MKLPLKQKLKLIRQRIYASTNFRGHVPIHILPHELGATIHVDDHDIIVPSALRWKLYKKGWKTRLDQLENEYGVGRHIRLEPESVVLDIGANAGEFAHVCARYSAAAHCLEPDPSVFSCLLANTSQLENVACYDTLIWKKDEEIDFFSVPQSADSSVFADSEGPCIKKRAISVETFCKDNSIGHINLLKCDAEGAEPEVLLGIGSMFSNIQVIALDTGTERMGQRTNDECAEILRANGFSVVDEKIGKRLMTFGVNKTR